MDPSIKEAAVADYRAAFALSLKGRDYTVIMRELTFDGTAPDIAVYDIETLFDFIEKKIVRKKMSGVGCELGAGPAVFSAILAKRSDVGRIYAVEACAPLVTELMPLLVPAITGGGAKKVIGCVGDFSRLEIPSGSVDFIFEFFSLHHSADIGATLAECRRVLRRGGILIALDKARPNSLTENDRERMLDKEYDGAYKKQFGIPLARRLSRRDNGEHEYRLKDWQQAFISAGFGRFEHFRLDKTSGGPLLLQAIKRGISLLPLRCQPFFSCFLPHGNNLFDLSWENRVFTSTISHFRKEMSLLIAYAD
ncbi:MAG: class I SAM-dependent methyltransferase [bacterium]|nr:class I SAM-dependent methyltransferase [bacterium]